MNRLLLEIGTEEIPASYIAPALDALAAAVNQKLTTVRLAHGKITTHGTPRRLVLMVDDMAMRQESVTEQLLGPPERIAFDPQKAPTLAALKFAEKVGVSPERLTIAQTEKGRYVSATLTHKGTTAKAVLQQLLPELILSIPFPKSMRWADSGIAFARPIQSVLALLDRSVIAFTLDGTIKSGRQTAGHMFMHRKKIQVAHPNDYIDNLRQAQVIVDIQERRNLVELQIDQAAKDLGGRILNDPALVDIVTNLVEIPYAVGGRFDQGFLELPREILITSMREHQKYFAVIDDQDRLLPCFVAVNNTRPRDPKLVASGHERVLRARLSDAQFFFRADVKHSMDAWLDQLKGVLFQAQLGSMHAKAARIESLGVYLAAANVSDIGPQVMRAAQLCKADLVSQVVYEFPNLQGVMGRIYAAKAGEAQEVAAAIEEHYRPTYSGGPLPQTPTGALLAVADKLDTICGCFSVGLIPTGASDPYALRRQGIGIAQIMQAHQMGFSLTAAIMESLKLYAHFNQAVDQTTVNAVAGFVQSRIAHMLAEQGFAKDIIAAVVSVSIDNIPHVWKRVSALQQLRQAEDFEPLAIAFKRIVNLLRKTEMDPSAEPAAHMFDDESETELFAAYQQVHAAVAHNLAQADYDQALRAIATLRAPVDRFFERVMVMAEDPVLRRNRLALLRVIAAMFDQIADFSKISV